ncbi:hypothetical protein [Actinomadura rubrisoli]|nr:hypothetical protein [Actinomadura rubrisoli]
MIGGDLGKRIGAEDVVDAVRTIADGDSLLSSAATAPWSLVS